MFFKIVSHIANTQLRYSQHWLAFRTHKNEFIVQSLQACLFTFSARNFQFQSGQIQPYPETLQPLTHLPTPTTYNTTNLLAFPTNLEPTYPVSFCYFPQYCIPTNLACSLLALIVCRHIYISVKSDSPLISILTLGLPQHQLSPPSQITTIPSPHLDRFFPIYTQRRPEISQQKHFLMFD